MAGWRLFSSPAFQFYMFTREVDKTNLFHASNNKGHSFLQPLNSPRGNPFLRLFFFLLPNRINYKHLPPRHIKNKLNVYFFLYSEPQLHKSKELNNQGIKIQVKRSFKSCFSDTRKTIQKKTGLHEISGVWRSNFKFNTPLFWCLLLLKIISNTWTGSTKCQMHMSIFTLVFQIQNQGYIISYFYFIFLNFSFRCVQVLHFYPTFLSSPLKLSKLLTPSNIF